MSTPKNGLSQQTIVMLNGDIINRAIRNVTGRTWQQGQISINGVTVDVYRDTTQGTSWYERETESADLSDEATGRETQAQLLARLERE